METVKPRGNTSLTVAVIVNILFCLVSIGCLIYKVRVLEEQVFLLQSDSSKAYQPEFRDNKDRIYRSKRSVESFGRSKSCSSCHNACVQLFGLGASAKVNLSEICLAYLRIFNLVVSTADRINSCNSGSYIMEEMMFEGIRYFVSTPQQITTQHR